ncbi:uncharacterized protein IL334_000071 [Kwoniella shivajii]|uniref:Uncharacterized protein n=1 Tax=Kwoniella shivajii TaxID=564305 RepID=A0ABZ1CN95_9TREE|nr:hypothetical protein IL334_000071 [Kwoniella shivajii]
MVLSFIDLLKGLLLSASLITATEANEQKRDSGRQFWNENPSCDDLRVTGSTWLHVTACALLNSGYDVKKNYHFQGDYKAVSVAEATVYKKDRSEYSLSTVWPDSGNDNWWFESTRNAIATHPEAVDEGWVKDGVIQTDNHTNADATSGLWALTGLDTELEVELDDDKLEEWFDKATKTPIILKAKDLPEMEHLTRNHFYAVKDQVKDKGIKKVTLYDLDKEKGHTMRIITRRLDPSLAQVGHLKDWKEF